VAGSLPNGSEFTISWVPKVLAAREGPVASDLVDIAQVFRRSGTLTVSWRDDGITSLADFEDKRVALWDRGNDLEVTAALTKAGLEAGPDYRRFDLGAGVEPFLARQVDVIQATVYNEYAQILEAANRRSGGPNLPTDLDTINYADEGTAMLQDAIFARASWLAEPGNEDLAIRFLRASFQGWIFCRDQPDDCVRYTLEAGVARGAGHQAWMLNEVNPLIWPSPDGIGIMDPDLWQATVDVALEAGIIRSAPAPGAYRTDLAEAALASLAERSDVDPIGESFQKGYVEITPDGE
jgi:NitT/TauT family transport system substrate-binding protein